MRLLLRFALKGNEGSCKPAGYGKEKGMPTYKSHVGCCGKTSSGATSDPYTPLLEKSNIAKFMHLEEFNFHKQYGWLLGEI